MSWDKIKKSLNSTLGTPDFKPLDQIIEDGINQTKSDLENGFVVPQKSKFLDGDWQDVELEISGETNYSIFYMTKNEMPVGVYVATATALAKGLSTQRNYCFLFRVSEEIENESMIYTDGSSTYSIKNRRFGVVDRISAHYQSSSGGRPVYLTDFRLKKII